MKYLVALSLLIFFLPVPARCTSLTLEERIEIQKKIEEVYWRHQIWPDSNPSPKPELSKVLSDTEVRQKVENYLKKSQALTNLWQRKIEGEELQAELNRIARATKKPQFLRELWNALGNDPEIIAECLIRPLLTDRLIRERSPGDFDTWWAEESVKYSAPVFANYHYTLPKIEASCSDDSWTPTSVNPPTGRMGHTSVWTGTEMIIWGGWNEVIPFNSGGKYNPVLDSWTQTSELNAPLPRDEHTAIWTGTEMIIWAGEAPGGGRYNPSSDTWAPINMNGAPSGQFETTAIWTGSEMIVWGGGFAGTLLNSGARYNPSSDAWTPTSEVNAPQSRNSHTAIWTGQKMIIWGGIACQDPPQCNSRALTNSGGIYDPITNSWTQTAIDPQTPFGRNRHSAIWTGSRMIIWGGEDEIFFSGTSTGGIYDPGANSWKETSTTGAPSSRSGHSAVWTGTEMLVWGGSPNFTGGRYNANTDSWLPISTKNTPESRSEQTAVWTGSEMLVWGGCKSDGPPNCNGEILARQGARYDPGADQWLPIHSSGTPSERAYQSTVWTGTEMIVWGGSTDFGHPLQSGSRYDPAMDQWISTSTISAPISRHHHSAVWTGTEMIVWGGNVDPFGLDFTNTGGRYNPATDSWQATTSTGAPSAREFHTAIWTGKEMIIWGGDADTSFFGDGSRYDPVLDSWLPISIMNSPSPRHYHTAVWTGTEMLIWGGSDANQFFNTGARYAPNKNLWQQISLSAAPEARDQHTAVWTGSEMIVWGGETSDFRLLNSGGRYSPFSNSWFPTAIEPEARTLHTAVWTGFEMIIFGGLNLSSDSGSRYNPFNDTWKSVSNLDPAGLPRYLHSAVWTGDSMVIWGGATAFLTVTGGIYCATFATPVAHNDFYDVGQDTKLVVSAPGVLGNDLDPQGDTLTAILDAAPTHGSLSLNPDGGFTYIPDPSFHGLDSFSYSANDASSDVSNFAIVRIRVNGPCLFCDEFEDDTLDPNWTYLRPVWSESGGVLTGTPVIRKAIAIASPAFAGCQICSIETSVRTIGGTLAKFSIAGWFIDKANQIELIGKEDSDRWILRQRVNGVIVAKAKAKMLIDPNSFYKVRIAFDGNQFQVFIDDAATPLITLTPTVPVSAGTFALTVRNAAADFEYVHVE